MESPRTKWRFIAGKDIELLLGEGISKPGRPADGGWRCRG